MVLLSNLLNTFKIAKILLILIFKIQYLHSASYSICTCLRIPPWIAIKPHFAHTTAVEPRCNPRLNRGRTAVHPRSNRGRPLNRGRTSVQPRLARGFGQLSSRQYCTFSSTKKTACNCMYRRNNECPFKTWREIMVTHAHWVLGLRKYFVKIWPPSLLCFSAKKSP
jgi:hypothetical protein